MIYWILKCYHGEVHLLSLSNDLCSKSNLPSLKYDIWYNESETLKRYAYMYVVKNLIFFMTM